MNNLIDDYSKEIVEMVNFLFENPKAKRIDVINHFKSEYSTNVPTRILERLHSEAKTYNQIRILKGETQGMDTAVSKTTVNKDKIIKILCDIAEKDTIIMNKESVSVTYSDKIKAIDLIFRIMGWYAPQKAEITHKNTKNE